MDPAEPDDPKDWSIDRVIYQLCQNDSPAWSSADAPPGASLIPDRHELEPIFRKNHIDGETLLTLRMNELRDDLGVASYGQRRAILKVIGFLSQRYITNQKVQSYLQEGLATPEVTYSRRSPFRPSLAYDAFSIRPSIEPHQAFGSPSFTAAAMNHPKAGQLSRPNVMRPISHPPPQFDHRQYPMQQHFSYAESEQAYSTGQRLPPPFSSQNVPSNNVAPRIDTQSHKGSPAKKELDKSLASDKNRGYLDVLDDSINRTLDRKIRSPSTQRSDVGPQKMEETTQLVSKPKKRLAPTLVSAPVYQIQDPTLPLSVYETCDLQPGYLSQTPFNCKEIFCDGIDADADEDYDGLATINLRGPLPLTGIQRVIGRRMVELLRTLPIVNQQDGLAIIQAHVRAKAGKYAPGHQHAILKSIMAHDVSTLQQVNSAESAHAISTKRGKRNAKVGAGETLETFSTDGQTDDANSPDQYEYLLEKYPALEDEDLEDDEVLPLYGDSGDENEYDDATWEEIEQEKRQAVEQFKVMTKEEVNQAIDEALDELRKSWLEVKLPKVQMKGYNLWLKAARERRRQIPIQAKQDAARRARQILAKYRQAIVDDTWQKSVDVKKQCQSLEMKLFDALENEHFIEVLHGDDPPTRPAREEAKPRPPRRRDVDVEDDEETISSESDVALDDFVVDDEADAPILDDLVDEDFNPTLPISERRQVLPAKKDVGADPLRDEPAPEPSQTPIANDSADLSAEEGDIDEDDSESILSPRTKSTKRKQPTSLSSHRRRLENMPDGLDQLDFSDSDSDLDAGPRLPRTKYRELGHSETLAINLVSSDDYIQDPIPSQSTSAYEVVTPDLNPIASSEESEDPGAAQKKSPLKLKLNVSPATLTPAPLPLFTRSVLDGGRPHLDDVKGIRRYGWDTIEERSDHKRAVRKRLYDLKRKEAAEIQALLDHLTHHRLGEAGACMDLINEGMQTLRNDLDTINGIRGVAHQRAAFELVRLYLTYVCCRDVTENHTLSEGEFNSAFEQRTNACGKCFEQIKAALIVYLQYLDQAPKVDKDKKRKSIQTDGDNMTKNSKPSRRSISPRPSDIGTEALGDSSEELPQSHRKKRKRHVAESQEALAQQHFDQQRIKEQEQRRSQMEKKLGAMARDHNAQHWVNTEDPVVYLNGRIAHRIKPHQLEGLRFLWREIVSDPKRQGCLLAHTMGLGKTMQIVSLLVTIAECTQSTDSQIRGHIPTTLKPGRTLILCPPTLLENWQDELAMWSPMDASTLLGPVRKILKGKDIAEIEAWAQSSGILLLGYNLFQQFLNPKKPLASTRITREDLEKWLLEDPSLVIADEAHSMKNVKSKITLAASRFKTLSRIALTGSPLNNHLEEYHTMINWVAPGYLGTMVQFKSKYSEPIMQGLWADSSAYERRLCLKKLHVLKRDLEPKVNRADISAIQKDMPSKTEFFITIPLTDLQRQAYDTFVRHLLDEHDGLGSKKNKLLAWLGDLLLLCSHPAAFISLCNARSIEHGNVEETGDETACSDSGMKDIDETNAVSPVNPDDLLEHRGPISRRDMTAMEAAAATFADVQAFGNLGDWTLSNRTLIVGQIVQKAAMLGDKTLIFSHSIHTLDMLQAMVEQLDLSFDRIDGSTNVNNRQKATKVFNSASTDTRVFLISTRAGGLGLNLQGANRVIIFDFTFNPMWEEQAVGRAYRLGQRKPVYVYRFRSGGTCEEVVNNKAVFKSQLFSRVVDKKNPERYAKKSVAEYLFPVRDIDMEDYDECLGKDPEVLDAFMAEYPDVVRNIELTETFQREDDEKLTEEELKAADEEFEDDRLRRNDPKAWTDKQAKKQKPFAAQPRMLPSESFQNVPGPSQGPPRPAVDGPPTLKRPKYLLHGSPRKVVTPDFHLHLTTESDKVAAGTANQDYSPSKIPQTDGTDDDPSSEAPSSGEDGSKPPGCKTQ